MNDLGAVDGRQGAGRADRQPIEVSMAFHAGLPVVHWIDGSDPRPSAHVLRAGVAG
ncbi:hypothetical protein [Nonomuraea sp. KM88]|uniref:hypothetical protein n=1 Tax=Nonomuraea sp. KM88 TaxID=3457427 RepID=UPI003FCE8C6F